MYINWMHDAETGELIYCQHHDCAEKATTSWQDCGKAGCHVPYYTCLGHTPPEEWGDVEQCFAGTPPTKPSPKSANIGGTLSGRWN